MSIILSAFPDSMKSNIGRCSPTKHLCERIQNHQATQDHISQDKDDDDNASSQVVSHMEDSNNEEEDDRGWILQNDLAAMVLSDGFMVHKDSIFLRAQSFSLMPNC